MSLNINIGNALRYKLKVHCAMLKVSMSEYVEQAITEKMQRDAAEPGGAPGAVEQSA